LGRAGGKERLANHVVQRRDVPGADRQVSWIADPVDGVPQVDHPAGLVVVELRAGAILGEDDQRLDEDVVEPARVVSQLAGEDLGLLVGQRDRARVNAAVLEDPLQGVAADLAAVALDLHVVQSVRRQDRDVVLVREAAAGRHLEVVEHEIVIGQPLGEPLDREGLAVILRGPDSMNDRHAGITSWVAMREVVDSPLAEQKVHAPPPCKTCGPTLAGSALVQLGSVAPLFDVMTYLNPGLDLHSPVSQIHPGVEQPPAGSTD
jgi:hypothetical protein